MNCQSISDILDERRMDRLTAAERCELDRHLAECADCASACRAEAALALQHVAPVPRQHEPAEATRLDNRSPQQCVGAE